MTNRRDILKTALILPAAIAGSQLTSAFGKSAPKDLPKGIYYTKENPGKWSKKVKSHAPLVSMKDGNITLETVHGMSEQHFIVRHTLVTDAGEVVGEKTFYPSDEQAISTFKIPANVKTLYATSFCNKHDLWIVEVTV